MIDQPTGLPALDALTQLARRQRVLHPTRGELEAADLHWWWRHDRRERPVTVWSDAEGPVAAVFSTRFRSGIDLAVVCLDDDLIDACRVVATELVGQHRDLEVTTAFADDDPDWLAWAAELGFEQTGGVLVTTWRDATPPPQGPLPDGYRLTSRGDDATGPHHMIDRNGEHVAERLDETALYRPDHDLFVLGPDGDVAAYGLFWPDPITGVGLVEPMRTEDAHQSLGLGRAVLTEGMRRLIDDGCTRLKISYFADNEPAERLYLGVGFVPTSRSTFLRRPTRG